MYDLTAFTLTDKVACSSAIRSIGGSAGGLAEAADRLVRFFYEKLADPATGERSCALVRFYMTVPYEALDDEQRAFASDMLGAAPASPKMKCLTLIATAGDKPAWNSPAASAGHRAIPLASEDMVRQLPMISQLITQLGLEVRHVLEPDPSLIVNLDETAYNVFYVPVAQSSPYIPAQDEFVVPYRIKSVLGVGGLLASGEFFALVLFARVHIPIETARLFKTFALSLKSMILAAALAEERA